MTRVSVSPMTPYVIQATEIYYLVFGALTLLGGIMGYVKVKSLPSLVMGVTWGLVLIGAGLLLFNGQTSNVKNLKVGLILGLLATAGLAGLFIPKVMINRAAPHVILMAVLSAIGMVLTLISFTGK
ncbi:MAG: TMEM14 family protein [Verrucomicrobia bacterium]|nr:TMEM14 family protein [Verrucomicrobiota bacterium]